MLRSLTFLCLGTLLLAGACSSNDANDASQFYGMWTKGIQVGDTLQFMRKSDKDILRYNMSFNASVTAYQEVEYTYKNGKLAVQTFGPGSELRTLESFEWKQEGKEFEVLGYQLYVIMSSTLTKFNFKKIN
ncbi:MAG: hypothetical protein ABIQ88_16215 [Chitinophagaceae bacterium]